MNKIKIMDELLANKIAAGEVIEKCASVVKELVENSIDAGAKKIDIDLIAAGIKEISVSDDGSGMSAQDATLAFERHATSKLKNEADLFFINTLGFRGEALPSIASVSEIFLKTSQGEVGTTVHLKGGREVEVTNSDSHIGTTIRVLNLFYNTPARLKYLKSDKYELAGSSLLIENLSLSHPNIKFTLTNDGKTIIKTSGSGDLLKCIHELYGLSISKNMIHISAENEDYEIEGYICKPEILKSNRNHFHTIVNGRIVKNLDLNRIVNDAYYTYKPDNKYPVVVINITCDPTLIDVNIHPTKQDIKFSKSQVLEELILNTIKNALYQGLLIPKISSKEENEEVTFPINHNNELSINEEQVSFEFKETFIEKNEEFKKLNLYPVGLALGTYIIAQNEEGIYLIDQHAANERINYELYMNALKTSKTSKIGSLIPITIELSNSEFLNIKERIDVLTNMGITLEEFGINTFVIKEHPTWLLPGYEEESIRRIIDLVIGKEGRFDAIKFNESIAITLACKMSVKANMNISTVEMEELLKRLMECDNPYNCPHGRPTIITFTKYELEKMFKRVM